MASEEERIFRQNEDQYAKINDNMRRISEVERALGELKADLIGVTGNNGLRGEVRQVKASIESVKAMFKWSIVTLISCTGVIIGALRAFGAA